MSTLTVPIVIAKYLEDRERIKEIRKRHAEELAEIEKFQKLREDWVMAQDDIEAFGFLTDIYLNGRDGKAAAEKAKTNFSVDMANVEKWLLKMLSKVGSGIKTDFGTVFKTRKESVSVADFGAYTRVEIFRPAAERIISALTNEGGEVYCNYTVEEIMNFMESSAHLDALTKAANKTYVLDQMGEADKKTGARPNAVPAGIDYKTFSAVGVRKPGAE